MLVEAVSWRPDAPRSSVEDVVGRPELARYVSAWPRRGDLGMVAEVEQPVGAAWLRSFPEHDRGYGFVDPSTPELAMGVAPARRGRGVGSRLLDALLVAARRAGAGAVSLSVERDNPARRLYERFGFAQVGELGGSLTMLRRL
jgi:ribosomal protein S18 acetylase RimI-like enzyme